MSNQHQGIQFERPIGAPADVNELEYVSALHQTCLEGIRTNGTISAKDVRNYLTSRHGIYVDAQVIQKRIIQELGGAYADVDDEDDPKRPKIVKPTDEIPMMDLCQVVALLLIPFLRQEDIDDAKRASNSIIHGMPEQVMNLILEELHRQGVDMEQFKAVDENFETGTRISTKLLQSMFDAYGEYSIPRVVLEEMVQHAADAAARSTRGGGEDDDDDFEDSTPRLKTRKKGKHDQVQVFLTHQNFLRALTKDVQLYHPEMEARLTTHLEDAKTAKFKPNTSGGEESSARNNTQPKGERVKFEDEFYTAPCIDQAADQYRSIIWVILLWVTLLLYFGLYVLDEDGTVSFTGCDSEFGCDAGSAIVNWLVVFTALGINGTLYIFLGSLGNSSGPSMPGADKLKKALGILVAMGVVAATTIVPNFVQGEAFIWNSNQVDGWEAVHWFCFVLGVILICLQFIRLLDVLSASGLGGLGVGGATRSEQCTKQAAKRKINIMVENAMVLHVAPIMATQKQPNPGGSLRFPTKYASSIVVKKAAQLHEEHEEEKKNNNDPKNKDKKKKYRNGNIQTLTGGEGSDKAMLNYRAMNDVTETAGGVLWAYQRIGDGRIYDEEGVWISARIITINILQGLVVALLVALYFFFLAAFEDEKSNTVAVGQRRLVEEVISSSVYHHVNVSPPLLGVRHLPLPHHHRTHRHVPRATKRLRRLQLIQRFNDTHYTDGNGVYPNVIYDLNSTHFTDGTSVWPYNIFSNNGTHVFDKYFPYNETHFTDGRNYFPYTDFATNGTHITNGEYLFDGTKITKVSGNPTVAEVDDWEFKIALGIGLVAALLGTIGLVIVFIPSSVSTVLKFRSGILKSLKGGEAFQKLRESPNHVSVVLGSALWGAFLTGFFLWLIFGGIIFLSVWSETRDAALFFYAILIGILVVFMVKFAITKLFRELYPSSFYRKHPAVVNFLNVIFECWNLALAVGSMLFRSLKMAVVTTYYIGRIDVPAFSPGVGYVGPFALDSEHFCFKKDLLIHEAHRHPYLERLGMMYLLKLHHGTAFGTRAGAYWRLLFVLALMPWMRDYRVQPPASDRGDDDDDSEADVEDDEFATEKSDDDDASVMSPHGMELELDLTRRVNESLTKRNSDLKDALAELRQRLRESNKKVAQLERRAARAQAKGLGAKSSSKSTTPGPATVQKAAPSQARAASKQQDDDDDDDSFESESAAGGPVSVAGASQTASAASKQKQQQKQQQLPDSFESESTSASGPVSVSMASESGESWASSQKSHSKKSNKSSRSSLGAAPGQQAKSAAANESFESESDVSASRSGTSSQKSHSKKSNNNSSRSTLSAAPAQQTRAGAGANESFESESDDFSESRSGSRGNPASVQRASESQQDSWSSSESDDDEAEGLLKKNKK